MLHKDKFYKTCIIFNLCEIITNMEMSILFFDNTNSYYFYLLLSIFAIVISHSIFLFNIREPYDNYKKCHNHFLVAFFEMSKYSILFLYFKVYYTKIVIFLVIDIILHLYYFISAIITIYYQNTINIKLEYYENIGLLATEECSICLENVIDDKYVTSCSHTFHEKCIKDWILKADVEVIQACPYCRCKLNYIIF